MDIISNKLTSEHIDLLGDLIVERLQHVNELEGISQDILGTTPHSPLKPFNYIYVYNDLYRLSKYIENKVKLNILKSFYEKAPHFAPTLFYQIDDIYILIAKEIEDAETMDSYIKYVSQEKEFTYRRMGKNIENFPVPFTTEIVNLLRITGAWRFMQNLGLSYLQKLQGEGYIPMPLARAMIGLALELGDQELLVYFNQNYLPTVLNPEKHIRVDIAIELTKLAREMNNKKVLGYFKNYLIEALHNRKPVSDVLTIEVLKFAREVDSRQDLADFLEQYFVGIIANEIHQLYVCTFGKGVAEKDTDVVSRRKTDP